jgi:hypothetical protein
MQVVKAEIRSIKRKNDEAEDDEAEDDEVEDDKLKDNKVIEYATKRKRVRVH